MRKIVGMFAKKLGCTYLTVYYEPVKLAMGIIYLIMGSFDDADIFKSME